MRTIVGRCLLAGGLLAGWPLTNGGVWAQEYSFKNFVGADGLGNLSIQKVYQDRVGFVWVSTEDGIFRYDGDRFDAFGPAKGIPDTRAADFGEAPDGSLLVGATFGLYRLNRERFEKVDGPFSTVSATQGVRSDGRGRTYLGTGAGLIEMSMAASGTGFAFRRIYPAAGAAAESAYGVFVDGAAVWFGCGVKLCRLDANGVKVFGKEYGLLDVPLAAVLKDRDGNCGCGRVMRECWSGRRGKLDFGGRIRLWLEEF